MLTVMDYIAGVVFLLSTAALACALRRAVRSSRLGKRKAALTKYPPDLDAMRRRMAVVYTSADFAGYGAQQKGEEEEEEAAGAARPLSRREALRQKLCEALAPGAPDESDDTNDIPDEDDVDSAAAAGGTAKENGSTADVEEVNVSAPPDPAADFFRNRQWEAIR